MYLICSSSVEDVRYIMGYIVDLTVILHWLFISGYNVSANNVQAAMNHHVKSGSRDDIHQDIVRFVTEETSFTYRGKDLIMEKIIDLIKQTL